MRDVFVTVCFFLHAAFATALLWPLAPRPALYITSQHLNGQVVFVILEYHNWWVTKYGEIVAKLSVDPVIDFSNDKRIHCFPEMIIGLNIHDELSVNPELMKDGKSIRDFRALLSKAYAPRLNSMPQIKSTNDKQNLSSLRANVSHPEKPKLVIVSRQKSREIMNQKAIVKLGEKIGFEVEILNPRRETEMVDMFRSLNSCDVMVGVHGAAVTHFLFMRPGSVFIQIVPLGWKFSVISLFQGHISQCGHSDKQSES